MVLTDKIGGVVVRSYREAYAAEEVHHPIGVPEIGGLSVAEEEELVEHVEYLRRRLVDGHHNCFPLFFRVPFQTAHQRVGGM